MFIDHQTILKGYRSMFKTLTFWDSFKNTWAVFGIQEKEDFAFVWSQKILEMQEALDIMISFS